MNPRIVPPLLLLLSAATATGLRGSVVLSNLSEASSTTGQLSSSVFGAWSFTTGSSPATLDSVGILLGTAANTSSDFVIRLRTDSGGLPGSNVTGFGGATTPNGSSGGTLFTYTPAIPTTLAPNTSYWLVFGVRPGAGSYTIVSTSSDAFGTSGSGWLGASTARVSTDTGATWAQNPTDIPQLTISATAVPEPLETATIAGAMLAGFGVLRRSRSRKAIGVAVS